MLGIFRKSKRQKYMETLPQGGDSGIIPLREIKTAMVLCEMPAPDLKEAADAFFGKCGISWSLVELRNKDVNWWGKPSDTLIKSVADAHPDLFISLCAGTHFPGIVLASHSAARFKIGRQRINGKVFDVVISDPMEGSISAAESFKAISSYLEKIQ